MTAGPAAVLRVFAAGSLKPAFDVLAAASPGTLQFDYANARDLAQRIVAGEPADVFASASPEHPAALAARGLVGEPHAFASNRLVIAVPRASAATDPSVLAARGTRVVIEVEGIPLGDYTRELLRRLDATIGNGYASAALANVVAEEQTVFAVAARLVSGEADAAVLYATDVVARPTELRAIEVPVGAEVPATCVACVAAASRQLREATEWVAQLTGAGPQETLREAGFGPAPGHRYLGTQPSSV